MGIHSGCRKYLKNNQQVSTQLPDTGNSLPHGAWLASHWQAMTNLFLSHRDSLTQSSWTVSTQLARFPLTGHYQANPVLQIPHSLCGAHQANPCFLSWTQLSPHGKENATLTQFRNNGNSIYHPPWYQGNSSSYILPLCCPITKRPLFSSFPFLPLFS